MGVDYDAELVVGFYLESDKMAAWLEKNKIENDTTEINKFLEAKFEGIPVKEYVGGAIYSGSLSLYIVCYGNHYQEDYSYYLSFFRCSTTIRKIKNITPELLALAKKIYKDIMDTDIEECETVDDIPVHASLYIW